MQMMSRKEAEADLARQAEIEQRLKVERAVNKKVESLKKRGISANKFRYAAVEVLRSNPEHFDYIRQIAYVDHDMRSMGSGYLQLRNDLDKIRSKITPDHSPKERFTIINAFLQ